MNKLLSISNSVRKFEIPWVIKMNLPSFLINAAAIFMAGTFNGLLIAYLIIK